MPHLKLILRPFFENNNMPPGGHEPYNPADPYDKRLVAFDRGFQRIERCIGSVARVINDL